MSTAHDDQTPQASSDQTPQASSDQTFRASSGRGDCASSDEQPTQLVAGGGKPAKVHDEHAPSTLGTLPLPQPGVRPDDPTTKLESKHATSVETSAHMPAETPAKIQDKVPAESTIPTPFATPALLPAETPVEPRHQTSNHSSQRRAWLIAGACILVLVCALIAGTTYAAELWGGRTVPDIAGLTSSDARARLEAAGFAVEIRSTPSDDKVGSVVSSQPSSGERQDPGSTVTLLVATPRVVPTLVGLQLDEARSALSDAGITNVRLEYKNSDEPEGSIIGVNPGRGTVVTADQEVTVHVAQPYTVPDVVGLSQDDATKTLAQLGLGSKIVWKESSGKALSVLATSPVAGERATSGQTVEVTVVAPGARQEIYLPDYLSDAPHDVSSYLAWKGWTFRYGKTVAGTGTFANTTCAETGWSKTGVGTLILTPTPQSSKHGSFLGELLTHDVLAERASLSGIRFEPEHASADADTIDSGTLNTWASRCGLSGLSETFTRDDIERRLHTSGRNTPDILVGYGEDHDTVWSIAVTKGNHVVITCAPRGLYQSVDLSSYDNSLGLYLASCSTYGA